MKKNKLLSLLLIGSIVLSVSLVSCDKEDEPSADNPDYSDDKGEFKDSRDAKVYNWVKIGEQVWMSENLAYTGSGIQHITDGEEWGNNEDYDGWSYYDINENYGKTFGVLYQWEAAKIACPSGWHLPTGDEWSQLRNYLQENGYSYDGVVGNYYIAKSLATDNGWSISDNQGAVGNSDFTDFRNKTGFSALPSGTRNRYGDFYNLGDHGSWWLAEEGSNYYSAYLCRLNYDDANMNCFSDDKLDGFSVRCVRD